jgi:hypothetical protein
VYQRFFQASVRASQFGQGLTIFSYTTPERFSALKVVPAERSSKVSSPERAVPDAAGPRATIASGC